MKKATILSEAGWSLALVAMIALKAYELQNQYQTTLLLLDKNNTSMPASELTAIMNLKIKKDEEILISSINNPSLLAEEELAEFIQDGFRNVGWNAETGSFVSQRQEIGKLQKKLQLIIKSIDDGICVINTDGYITHINATYAGIFGRTAEEMTGESTMDTSLEKIVNKVFVSGERVLEYVAEKFSGALMAVEANPIIMEGKMVGVISILRSNAVIQNLHEVLKVAAEKTKYMEQKIKKDQEKRWYPERYISETLEQKLVRTLKPVSAFKSFIGLNAKVLEALALAGKAAQTHSTVLIYGKSGTGKELVAEGIHQASPRFQGPLIRVNCAAIPDNLLESELFGHEKGAFTGAIKKKLGKFELADRGTIFLDEIGEMDLGMQTKLLRVLQNSSFERVGGETTIEVDVKVIAATNRNLEQMIKAGQFRDDLYYRLNVIPIYLPSLNERKEDIPLLVDYLFKCFNQQLGKQIKGISQAAMDALVRYDWPGNVRELKNIIERVVVLTDENYIDLCDLPCCFHQGENGESEEGTIYGSIVKEKIFPLEKYEKQIIRAALEKHGSYTAAAKALGITHKTVAAKAQKYGLLDWINRWMFP